MTKVIAALDTSMAAQPVLLTTLALGKVLAADVEAVHVPADGDRVPRDAAAAEQVPLRIAHEPVVDALVRVAEEEDVVAVVVGARGSPLRRKPLGSTALAVAASVNAPVLVVPPDPRHPGQLQRVLLPLEAERALVPRVLIALAEGTGLDLFVLHVLEDEDSLPLFTDQPQHEYSAQVRELVHRCCPSGIDIAGFEVRVGRRDEVVPAVAEELAADVVALGWAQELAPDRAPIVRAALDRAHIPVLLVPVQAAEDSPTRGEAWSSSQSSPD